MTEHTAKFVAYYRLSAGPQGRSGLCLEAAEFTEVESAKREDNRPKREKALKACRVHRATLVIAKLDPPSRDPHFLFGLEKAGLQFVCVDEPDMTPLTLGIPAVVARHEREMIAARTRAALAAAKKRGVKLGGRRYKFQRDAKGEIVKDANGKPIRTKEVANGSDRARWLAGEAAKKRADQLANDLAPTIKALQKGGKASLRAIAAGLNEQAVSTPRGTAQWSARQVMRLLDRIRNQEGNRSQPSAGHKAPQRRQVIPSPTPCREPIPDLIVKTRDGGDATYQRDLSEKGHQKDA